MRLGAYERKPLPRISNPTGRNRMAFRWVSTFHITRDKPQHINWYVGTRDTATVEKAKLIYQRQYALSEYQRQQTLKNERSDRVDWMMLDMDALMEEYPVDTDFITEEFIKALFDEKQEKLDMIRYVMVSFARPNKSYPNGGFVAKFMQGGKCVTQRSFSVGKYPQEEAYKLAIKAGKDLAKEQGCELKEIPTQKEMVERAMKHGRTNPTEQQSYIVQDGTQESELMAILSNKFRFNALVRRMVSDHGVDRVLGLFESAIETIEVLAVEFEKQEKVQDEAHMKMAQAIIDAREQGIKMVAPNAEIEAAIKKLMMQKPVDEAFAEKNQ